MALGLCIAAAGKKTALAITAFSLSWVHSVEKIEWRENWAIRDGQFVMTEARVKGSGAGMEPGDNARLIDGWWVWKPDLPPEPEMHLAASGATVSAWSLCYDGGCLDLGAKASDGITLMPCEIAGANG